MLNICEVLHFTLNLFAERAEGKCSSSFILLFPLQTPYQHSHLPSRMEASVVRVVWGPLGLVESPTASMPSKGNLCFRSTVLKANSYGEAARTVT